ncbi:TetR/AcrR family transcriptional regulator [Streptomyces sp. NPDC046316]|uniref:TetR/AcrR family transcriptional regulator n=1 Tax=Streptomyces sp. NPDC046316 TaxID=3154494 RepID=UPI0033E5790F
MQPLSLEEQLSPRGVATPNVRERLFEAAEAVLEREGPAGLTNRSVTEEAGCAKGLLYNHFTDLDDFVAQLVLDRFRRVAEEVAPLPGRAGEGAVLENLTEAALALLGSHGAVIAAVALSRRGVTERVEEAWAGGAPGPTAVENALAAYLEEEQRRGRVGSAVDCPMLALAVTGTVHHLLMTGGARPGDDRQLVRRLVGALAGGATAAGS